MAFSIKKHEITKLSNVVICFSLFMASMLFQTSYMRLGTIVAAGTMFLTVGAFLLRGSFLKISIKFNGFVALLLLFLIYTMFGCYLNGHFPSYFIKFVTQILFCALLFSVDITERENEYLKWVFTLSSSIYAVLVIITCIENAREGYARTDILLFGAELDPNFVGIPFVASMTLLLDNVLKKKRTFISIALYVVNAIAIVYTASRGSFLSAIISSVLVFLFFLFSKKIKFSRKLFYFILLAVIVGVLIKVIEMQFPLQWERLNNFDSGDMGSGRIDLWKVGIRDWWNSPLFGNGFGYARLAHNKVTHNTYIQLLNEMGLVGFGIAISFFILILKKAYEFQKILFCTLLVIMIQIFFLDAIDDRCLWVILCWMSMLPKRPLKEEIKKAE